MFTPPTPPPNPDEHYMYERSRREAAERDARNGLSGKRRLGMSTGDKIIFLVLAAAVLFMIWLFLSWLLG